MTRDDIPTMPAESATEVGADTDQRMPEGFAIAFLAVVAVITATAGAVNLLCRAFA